MLTGNGLVKYAKSKVGTPYFYGSKMEVLTEGFMQQMHRYYPSIVTSNYIQKARNRGQVGKVNVDCSGLIGAYRKKQLGSSQLYQTAKARLNVNEYKKWANGVVCWRNGHVGVFANENGEYVVYEAKGIDYGTVRSKFTTSKWSYGLTFSDIDYSYVENVEDIQHRQTNPYKEPTTNIKKGMVGEGVKWVQWELVEAGYNLDVDGEFGPITYDCVLKYQRSTKQLEVDGIVGPMTRKFLKGN